MRNSKGKLAAVLRHAKSLGAAFGFFASRATAAIGLWNIQGLGWGTLNDIELRKNFRRKNTLWKPFLGHARGLDDMPIKAAMAQPTLRFAAHGMRRAGPRLEAIRASLNAAADEL